MKVPSLVVAADSTQLAMLEEGRVTVVDGVQMRATAEIGIAGTAADNDVVLVGRRLAVVTRSEAETRLFVVDPAGPEKLGESVTRPHMRLGAVAGDHVLLIGATTALVDLRQLERPPVTLPIRGAVTAAGAMGDSRMVLVIGQALEEWDATTRSPARRLRLDRALDVIVIGGSERRIWMVLRPQPKQIEILNLDTKSTRVVELPEPIEQLHAHPTVDVLLAIGATTRSAYVVRGDRDHMVRLSGGPFNDCGWLGHQIVTWPVDGYPTVVASPVELDPAREDDDDDAADTHRTDDAPVEVRAAVASQNLRSALSQPTFSERLASWKATLDETRGAAPPASAIADAPAPDPAVAAMFERRVGGWRGDIATWSRAILARSLRPLPFLDPNPLDELVVRFELAATLRPALALLYGAHLIGAPAVARHDLASVIDWRWSELGGGGIATAGLVRERGGRLELVREVTRALDESPPYRGTLVGSGRGDPGDGVLVAPPSTDARELAAWAEALASAPLLVANERGRAKVDRFLLEAKVRGAVPVVEDEAVAAATGLRVLGRWPGLGVA